MIKKKKNKTPNSRLKVKRRKVVKKAVKKTPKKTPVQKKLKENIIGEISHYFPHVMAGVIKLKKPLAAGDEIKIKGHTTDFTQKVISMQIDRVVIESAKKGDEIGLLVESRVRRGDIVYKV